MPLIGSAVSRNVAGIGFSDPAFLRLGFINDYIYGWPDNESDIKQVRARPPVAEPVRPLSRHLPAVRDVPVSGAFAGSRLCWTGTVAWEGSDEQFETLAHADRHAGRLPRGCRPAHFRRSIQRDIAARHGAGTQRIRVDPPRRQCMPDVRRRGRDRLAAGRINARRMIMPAILIGAGLLAALFIDSQFIGGMRPLDSGDDGIAYEGFGRAIVRFAGRRYFCRDARRRAGLLFYTGAALCARARIDYLRRNLLLYFSAMLLLPILASSLFRRFLPPRWALGLILGFCRNPDHRAVRIEPVPICDLGVPRLCGSVRHHVAARRAGADGPPRRMKRRSGAGAFLPPD